MKINHVGLLLLALLPINPIRASTLLPLDPVAEHVAVSSISADEKIAWELNQVLKPVADGSGSVVRPQVKAGMVSLQGSSPSRDAIRQLMELASNVPGVREVRSEIALRPI